MTQVIDSFTGQHGFLSNFHPSPLVLDGVPYPSAEHAFNTLKTLDAAQAETVRTAPSPGMAKRAGRRVTLRPGWDEHVRFDVMAQVVRAKFTNRELRAALLGTGDALLIEGTGTGKRAWHDQTWGQCFCPKHASFAGGNHLGRILMAERARLRADPTDRWVRVAVTGHRPKNLTREQSRFAIAELRRLAAKVADRHGTTTAISGMALGADTWWAEAALQAGLDLWAYVPFEQQPNRWRPADLIAWQRLRQVATRELVLGEGYDVRLLHSRNAFMIRDADLVIAVMDPAKTTGGTAEAMKLAREQDKPHVLVDVVARRSSVHLPTPGPRVRQVSGDLLADDAQMLVNPVNCVGVMGKGLAKAFRDRWPAMFESYRAHCANGSLLPGGVHLWTNPDPDGPRWIVNVATKNHWREGAHLEWVREGAHELVRTARGLGVTSLAVPAMGAGLGGLTWEQVRPVLLDELVDLHGADVRLYAPVS